MIEEIKIRLSNLDHGKIVKYDHAMNLATQYMVDYRNDVAYLLSIIEQAEKALERAKDYLESGMHYGPSEAIDEVLQAIRRE